MDASSTLGFGAYLNGAWMRGNWQPHQQLPGWSIQWQELFAILAAALTWGHLLSGQHIPFHCDNLPILQAWANQSSKHLGIMELLEDTLLYQRTAQLHCVPCAPPGSAELHPGCSVTQPHVTLLFSGHRYIDHQHHSPHC